MPGKRHAACLSRMFVVRAIEPADGESLDHEVACGVPPMAGRYVRCSDGVRSRALKADVGNYADADKDQGRHRVGVLL